MVDEWMEKQTGDCGRTIVLVTGFKILVESFSVLMLVQTKVRFQLILKMLYFLSIKHESELCMCCGFPKTVVWLLGC